MNIIIPIGGGSIKEKTTLEIDKYILSLKEEPKVLFIPIASGDNIEYSNTFKEYYESLGAKVDILYLKNNENDNMIRSKIFSNNIIYIGGGNTAKTFRVFKRTNINEYLLRAMENGTILTGLSAGAMIYFKAGLSDANRSTNENNPLSYLKCMDYLPYIFSPHYNEEERKMFDTFILDYEDEGIAIDDDVAVEFVDGKINKVIKSNKDNNAYIFKDNKKEIL